ncbi:MAG: hypothetical protein HY234_04705 [Acidobacteria bacterium]|nr:hypothetical protein [Acidobacteriota bacterium]
MAMTVVVTFALACLFTTVARAADEPAKVAGKWEMSFEGPQGPVTRNLTIEQDGEKIKGTLSGPRGDAEFKGAVKGKNISFSVTRQTPNGERTIEYKGAVDGDNMKGTVEMMGNSREWTAKRAK